MKRDRKKQGLGNIVLFPNLYERLVSRGLEELENKNFKKAMHLFTQAREYETENAEVNLGLLVSLVEVQHYEDARVLCQEMLKQGMGDYFQIMSIYLMVLLQMGEHEEMVQTIELLFQENQIPFDKIDHFQKMLSFSKNILEKKENEIQQDDEYEHQLQEAGLLSQKSDQELLDIITKLSKMNIRPFIDEIQQFLLDENMHPFYKTLLLNILKEQDYTNPIELTKFSRKVSIIPSQLEDIRENAFYKKVSTAIENVLSQQDPSLLEIIHSLLDRHRFLLYPLEPQQDSLVMASAYHALAEEYMTGQEISDTVANIYKTDIQKVKECMNYLKKIEAISYPII